MGCIHACKFFDFRNIKQDIYTIRHPLPVPQIVQIYHRWQNTANFHYIQILLPLKPA